MILDSEEEIRCPKCGGLLMHTQDLYTIRKSKNIPGRWERRFEGTVATCASCGTTAKTFLKSDPEELREEP